LKAHRSDLAISANLEDRWSEGIARGNVGLALHRLGRLEDAASEWRQACGIFNDLGESETHGWALDGLGNTLHSLGRNEEAVTAYEQAIAALRTTADHWTQAQSAYSLASIWWDLKDYERAAPGFAQAARLAGEADLNVLSGIAWGFRLHAIRRLWWQRIRGRRRR
jgi:tetratricopeptide (TPR) repeat protein